ncbi:MAG: hypothetical protein WA418_10055 [Bradyrhizobium sp.]
MNDFAEYMELIVEPTFEDFSRHAGSVRQAYLACLAIYHAVDRAAYPGEPRTLAEQWRTESVAFMLVEEVAQHFKHGRRRWVEKAKAQNPGALLITHPLGLESDLKGLETRSLYFQARDAVLFLREKAKLAAQAEAPSSPPST